MPTIAQVSADMQRTYAQLIREALAKITSAHGMPGAPRYEMTSSGPMSASVDQWQAIGGHVSHEYGDYGYSVEYARGITHLVMVAQIRHADGTRFILAADRWGNVRRLDESSLDEMAGELAAMHERAVTP